MFVPVTVVILIFTAMGSVVSDTYKKGGVAVLSPGSVSGPITSVTWKHGPDIAVERYGEETIEYREFKGRCEVDTNTGALRISNLSVNDSGIYMAEINSRITGTTEITVITAVPKPTISTQCNPEKTQCTLTCEANITTDTGPVTYSWETGDRQRPSSSKQLVIAKDDPELIGQPISCQLENPVSREHSDDIMSPFMNESSGGVNPAAVIVPIVLIVVLVGLVFWHKRRPENAEKSWSEYLAGFDPRSCLNRERNSVTEVNINGAVTRADYQEVPTHDLEGPASQDTRNAAERNRVTEESSGEAATSSENEEDPTQDQPGPVPTDTNDEAETSSENQEDPSQDQPGPVPTDTNDEAENQTGSNQTPADSEDLSSGAETSAVASKTEETLKHHPLQED